MLHLYRRTIVLSSIAAFLIAVLITGAWSQSRKRPKGPRALGVVEITSNGKARLIPVGILVNDKWFDAGLYLATPRPMALEPETVYEGEQTGEPQGLFTLTGAAQLGEDWIGLGTWKPKEAEAAPKKPAEEKPTSAYTQDEDERPILRKPGAQKQPVTPPPAPPATTTASQQSGASQPAAAAESKPADKAIQAAKPTAPSEEESSRPRLRRGTSGVERAEGIAMPSSAEDFKTIGGKNDKGQSVAVVKAIAAISDASGPEPRSYVFHTNPGERASFQERMGKLASEAVQKFVATRFKGMSAPSVTADNSALQIFDISSSNEPVLVLTVRIPASQPVASAATTSASKTSRLPKTAPAQQPVSGVELDATVVARVDYQGDLHKLFANVTDTTRLDAYPRLDLVDAVDANGDSVAELLFRETFDRGHAFVVYRVGADQLWKVFETAERQ